MRDWTTQARKKQSQLIHQWKPWQQSSGAKTEPGKQASKMNAYKHGGRSKDMRELQSIVQQWLRKLN